MAKTAWADGSHLTPAQMILFFGNNAGTGHDHDGTDDDGHCPPVDLVDHVTGILPIASLQDFLIYGGSRDSSLNVPADTTLTLQYMGFTIPANTKYTLIRAHYFLSSTDTDLIFIVNGSGTDWQSSDSYGSSDGLSVDVEDNSTGSPVNSWLQLQVKNTNVSSAQDVVVGAGWSIILKEAPSS